MNLRSMAFVGMAALGLGMTGMLVAQTSAPATRPALLVEDATKPEIRCGAMRRGR